MRLEHLQYLIEIDKCGSLTTASENLHMTRQALSMAIKTLEGEVGTQILLRSVKGVRLTEYAQEFLKLAYDVTGKIEEFERKHDGTPPKNGYEKLKILTVNGLRSSVIAKIFSEIATKDMGIQLEVENYAGKELVELMKQGYGDIGFVYSLTGTENNLYDIPDKLHFTPLFECDPYIWVGEHSLLAEKRKITLEEILEYPIIIDKEYPSEPVLQMLEESGGAKNIIYASDAYLIYQMIIFQGALVMDNFYNKRGNLYRFFSQQNDLVAIPLKVNYKIWVGYLLGNGQSLSPAVKTLFDVL